MKKDIISLVLIAVSITACSSNEIKPTVKAKPVVKKIVKKATPKVVVKKPTIKQQPFVVRNKPKKRVVRNYMAQGSASRYRLIHNGMKTASGEIYDLYGMTAAHASLPFLSKVRVKNLRNGRSVVVTITDRLYDNSKLIKLSYWAARKLDLIKHPSRRVLVKTF
ncbi:septal ring lytic transglycosylase RlpA family protein [Candidatus Marithrix sp. Canyon 246]|uniref:septal ring lytic transglycosylase RlpA family protein n=1 Tax=Candidatus Marithrix sp. Canyon 246 TaxID=1827136 RepID=UPI00084A19F1|nr:septal ring lytic transglycosylase RlpA family protein [Candidatus Marithrix sp. Canyon 246]